MTLEWIRFIVGSLFILFGIFFVVSSLVGNFRFKFSLNRMHSAALMDTTGLFGMILGLCFYSGFNGTSLKLLIIIAIVWLTSPIASHLIMLMDLSNGRYTEEVREEYTDEEGLERSSVVANKNAMSDAEKEIGKVDKE